MDVLKKIINLIYRNLFIIVFVLAYFIVDQILISKNPIVGSYYFVRNDIEMAQEKHKEAVWDKVFFGNSVTNSAYIEEESESGYYALAIDYGVIEDIYNIMTKKVIVVGNELVIGLNYLTFYDDLDTNETYLSHKEWFMPYMYFERDRFYPLLTEGFDNLLDGKEIAEPQHAEQIRKYPTGALSEEEMEKRNLVHKEKFWGQTIDKFDNNFKCYDKLIKYCESNNIRLRAVWMPWRTKYEMPKIAVDVKNEALKMLDEKGIDYLDLDVVGEFPDDSFHDMGHLNHEIGAKYFMETVDDWLKN